MKEFKFKIGGTDYVATVEDLLGGKMKVTLNGKGYDVELPQNKVQAPRPVVAKAAPVAAATPAAAAPAAAAPASSGGARVSISAPLPGVVIKIKAKVGDKVAAGDTVLMIEAMKMENNITADAAGTIKAILCKEGDQVQSGQVLVELD